MARHPYQFLFFGLAGLLALSCGALSSQVSVSPACALLAKSDVQSIIGKPVKEGPVVPQADPGTTVCEYVIGDDGLLSVRVKAAGPAETPDAYLAGLAASKIRTEAAPGFGDRSFLAYPGVGMSQLYAFQGGRWVVLTLMIPGQAENTLREPLEKLMGKALATVR